MTRCAVRAAGGILALAITLTWTLTGCGSQGSTRTPGAVAATLTPTIEGDVQVFNVVGLRTLEFSATVLIAEPGQVRVDFSVEDQSAPHNFVVPDIADATTRILSAGESQSITFQAGERGLFQVICTLHPNMLATLKIV